MEWTLTIRNRCREAEVGSEDQGFWGRGWGGPMGKGVGYASIHLWTSMEVFPYVNYSDSRSYWALPRWNGKLSASCGSAEWLLGQSCSSENWRVSKGQINLYSLFWSLGCFRVCWDGEYSFIQTVLGYQKLSFPILDQSTQIRSLWAEFSLQMCFI